MRLNNTPPSRDGRLEPGDLRNIIVFVVVTFGLAWLVTLPLWRGGASRAHGSFWSPWP